MQAGLRWNRLAQDCTKWRNMGEVYIRKWVEAKLMMMMMMKIGICHFVGKEPTI